METDGTVSSERPIVENVLMSESDQDRNLPRVLGPAAAVCVVVGSVIGSGIFLVPAAIATNVPYTGGIAAAWILGGVFSMAGALTLAELARCCQGQGVLTST